MNEHEELPGPASAVVSVFTDGERSYVVLAGELDGASASELDEAMNHVARLDLPVDVDTREVTFMDSTLVRSVARLATRSSHRPRFVAPSDMVRFLLDVTGVDRLVDVDDHSTWPPHDQP